LTILDSQYNAPGKKQATRKILDIRPVIQLIEDLQQDAQSLKTLYDSHIAKELF